MKKALLITGSQGSGKTTLAHTLGKAWFSKEETYFAELSSPKSIPSKTKLLVIDEIATQKDLDQIAADMENGWPISEFRGQLVPSFLIIITQERFPLKPAFIEMDLDKNVLTIKVV